MADDQVIDIKDYLARSFREKDLGVFAVWGGEGERSRFALPLWRAIFLVGGDWGGIVSLPKLEREGEASPLMVLDLKQDPARLVAPNGTLQALGNREAPSLAFRETEGLAVVLGEDADRRWYLQVAGGRVTVRPTGKDKETLLFLAGECAGLLFYRELATPYPSSSSTP
jgi:hypothetical protein